MERELVPIRTRARDLASDPRKLVDILAKGAAHAKEVASNTMREVKQKMGLA
jgi:hypothetical protein